MLHKLMKHLAVVKKRLLLGVKTTKYSQNKLDLIKKKQQQSVKFTKEKKIVKIYHYG